MAAINKVTMQSLSTSYRTILLLAGSVARAERAMLEAIQAMDPDEMSSEGLLRSAITAAVTAAREAPARAQDPDPASSALPLELKRVQRLPADLRHCFVLRILAAFSRADCARLLNLSIPKVDERTCEAARNLAVALGPASTVRDLAAFPSPLAAAI
jgi:DNA-directed RNA polymerase specialized sigma24 family protein